MSFAATFKALSDPVRREIVPASEKRKNVCRRNRQPF